MSGTKDRVRIADDQAVVELAEGAVSLPIVEIAPPLLEWLQEGRHALYGSLVDGGTSAVRFFAQHLPMVVTQTQDRAFPFNCGNKGVGFLPRPELLGHFTEIYREALESSKNRPWQDSLLRRVDAVRALNLDAESVDQRCLVTLEIFARQTYRNLVELPLASLLYTGHSPRYLSFQVNCVVEIIGPEDPRHTFVTLARTMFEYDDFHITQHRFPYAYVFWISECLDKTPHRTVPSEQLAPSSGEESMPWDEEALATVSRAPATMQSHLRKVVEVYAVERGFSRVTRGVVEEAKRNLMDGR